MGQRRITLPTWATGWRGLALAVGGCVVLATLGLSLSGRFGSPKMALTDGSSGPGASARTAHKPVPWPFRNPLPGMPPVVGDNVYSQDGANMLSPAVKQDPAYLYVPDSNGSTVTVVSQKTHKIVRVIPSGYMTQHVVPSYDMKTLYANASVADQLIPINPRTARRSKAIHVPRPYNLYFTPNGKEAVVMVEQHDAIRFSDPHTFHKIADVHSPSCKGPNHADFSANGRFFVVTCEFSGELLRVSTLGHKVTGELKLPMMPTAKHASKAGLMGMSMPQDVRLSPDGKTFYIADMGTNQLVLVNARTFKIEKTIGMPSHPHGIYPSRDGKLLYISDRGAGEVTVLDPTTNKIVDTWKIPGGGSPDMGGVSADGSMLWLSGRYDGVVYGFDTRKGKLVARIKVPAASPHGLAVWPQPGRYSLGHTGNTR